METDPGQDDCWNISGGSSDSENHRFLIGDILGRFAE